MLILCVWVCRCGRACEYLTPVTNISSFTRRGSNWTIMERGSLRNFRHKKGQHIYWRFAGKAVPKRGFLLAQ